MEPVVANGHSCLRMRGFVLFMFNIARMISQCYVSYEALRSERWSAGMGRNGEERWKYCKHCRISSSSSSLIAYFTPPMLLPLFSIPSSIRSSGYPHSICWSACKDRKPTVQDMVWYQQKMRLDISQGVREVKKTGVSFNKFFHSISCAFGQDYFCLMWWSYRYRRRLWCTLLHICNVKMSTAVDYMNALLYCKYTRPDAGHTIYNTSLISSICAPSAVISVVYTFFFRSISLRYLVASLSLSLYLPALFFIYT